MTDQALTYLLPVDKNQKPFQCGLCCASFDMVSELDKHVHQHSLTKPFQCGYCRVCYDTSTELAVHIDGHQLFLCVAKDSAFLHLPPDPDKNSSQNGQHDPGIGEGNNMEGVKIERDIEEGVPSESDVNSSSKKQTSRKFGLNCAVSSHTTSPDLPSDASDVVKKSQTESTVSCYTCKQTFKHQVELKKHSIEEHGDDRPFRCSHCQSCFKQNNHLSDHLSSVHRSSKPYLCPFCGDRFKIKRYLRHHLARKHQVDAASVSAIVRCKKKGKVKDSPSPSDGNGSSSRKTAIFTSDSRLSYENTEFEISVNEVGLPDIADKASGVTVSAHEENGSKSDNIRHPISLESSAASPNIINPVTKLQKPEPSGMQRETDRENPVFHQLGIKMECDSTDTDNKETSH